ncbi:glycosyltransferase family 2 protein [Flammeovirga sp. SJP92]|uniref:glycosyltransferase family 2 protein n=1 Tax=Flammeovirga sp. SJP92 TaxID=1775430 RepID=UPI000787F503|nr:glycosyltransferase family 2 protein [Flammeovirga sp. SJP92]KXX70415.1 hypothetical protein AVL50_09045 [Flammeovirga sp. SJP92]
MELSIIIINYNTFKMTCECIDSIYKETKDITFEIIVVDNASQECDPKLFSEKYSTITLIENQTNEGFGRANNRGMKAAKGDVFLLLNSDTIILDQAITKCYHFLIAEENKEVGVLGCKHINLENKEVDPVFLGEYNLKEYFLNTNRFIKLFRSNEKKDLNGITEVSGVSGAFFMLKSEVFRKTKGFDPHIFLYSEETDWCRNRIRPLYKIIYYPYAKILHKEGGSGVKEVMAKQALLSFIYIWFKKGVVSYYTFLLIYFINAVTNLDKKALMRLFSLRSYLRKSYFEDILLRHDMFFLKELDNRKDN